MHTFFHWLLAAVCASALTACSAPRQPAALTFAVFGDMPYSPYESGAMLDMLAEQAALPLAFTLHVGDLKNGSTPCDDAVFDERRRLLEGSAHPLVLLPGDNDWLDCRRTSAGAHDPYERLLHLRRVMFDDSPMAGALRPEAQPGVPEHRRWRTQGVVFVTLNVPGSPAPDDRRSAALRAATLDWLDAALDEAERTAAAALVIAFHASPDFESGAESRRYGWLLRRITEHALGTPRPLLLIHGDTHRHRVDHPLRHPADGRPLPHVTRLESHGSPWLGWSEVQVRPGSDTPFRILAHPYRRD